MLMNFGARANHLSVAWIKSTPASRAFHVSCGVKAPNGPIETLPFTMTRMQAEVASRAAVYANYSTSRLGFIAQQLFPSWFRRIDAKLLSLKAFLVPTYLIDAMYLLDVVAYPPNDQKQESTLPIKTQDAYLAGFNFAPLSEQPFISSAPSRYDLEPFDFEKHSQGPDGEEISVLPYTQNPAKLFKYFRNLPPQPTSIRAFGDDEKVKLNFSSPMEQIGAAYPIYQPVWLSEWECKEQDQPLQRLTIAMYDFKYMSMIGSLSVFRHAEQRWASLSRNQMPNGQEHEIGVGGNVLNAPPRNRLSDIFADWLSDGSKLSRLTTDSAPKLDKEPQIMRYSEWATRNRRYIDSLWHLQEARGQLAMASHFVKGNDALKVTPMKLKVEKIGKDELVQMLESSLETLEEQVEQYKPAWLNDKP